jgi:molybdate transport system ATP-binding protein
MTAELIADFTKQRPGHAIRCQLRIPTDRGSTLVLFGPSGVGKTTILRCLAGLEVPDEGSIQFNGESWFGSGPATSPQRRRIGYMAQGLSLFPHLTVEENVGYGLRRADSDERRARTKEMIDMLQLRGLETRRPAELSGGEQQRVALGRSLAPRPRLLLLDEPLSALDAVTREHVRHQLREVLHRAGTPTILVTHDRTDALTLGERVGIVLDGAVRQSGEIDEVFRNPADEQVARLLGIETVVAGTVVDASRSPWSVRVGSAILHASPIEAATEDVFVCIRASDVLVVAGEPGRTSARNQLAARIVDLRSEGGTVRLVLDAGFPLVATVTVDAANELGLRTNAQITALIKAPRVQLVARSAKVA